MAEPIVVNPLRERITLTAGSLICVLITLWLSKLLNLPAAPQCAGTLLQQPAWPLAIGLIWILLIGGAVLTGIFASAVHYEAGLFCAAIGIGIISVRLGPMRYALFNATGSSVYLAMAFELVLLYVGIATAWFILFSGSRAGWLPAEPPSEADEPIDQKLLALLMHVIVMIVVMVVLCRSDQKPQALASVALAGYLASLAAYQFVPTQPVAWFLAGPLVVGLLGYIAEYFNPWNWQIGDPMGYFSALARPLPLDYASIGIAATLLGYWTSRRWRHSADATDTNQNAA